MAFINSSIEKESYANKLNNKIFTMKACVNYLSMFKTCTHINHEK